MTIKEEKALRNYIKGLVRESLNEFDDDDKYFGGGLPDHYFDDEEDMPIQYDDEDRPDPVADGPEGLWYAHDPAYRDEVDLRRELKSKHSNKGEDDEIAGLDELRSLCENLAREAVKGFIMEKKKKGSKKSTRKSDGKKKGSKKSPSSAEKSLMNKLNSDGVNAASYYYKLYGAKTEAEKAAARSKGYKKAKGRKNDTGARYKFSPKERTRLNSMLTDR